MITLTIDIRYQDSDTGTDMKLTQLVVRSLGARPATNALLEKIVIEMYPELEHTIATIARSNGSRKDLTGVIENLPADQVDGFMQELSKQLAPGNQTPDAIDHALAAMKGEQLSDQ